VLKLGSCG